MVAHRVLFDTYKADHLIEDPGDAGSILIDGKSEGVVQIVTAGAETRTLPAPLKAGVTIAIILYTDGGDCTLTVTNGFNNANDSTITLDDAGDYVKLQSFNIGGTYRWRVLGSHGISQLPEEDTLTTDTINESTAGVGVTIDGVVLKDGQVLATQVAPTAKTTTAGLEAAEILGGLITVTHSEGANQDYQLPLGTELEALITGTNHSFEWSLINLSGTPATNTATITVDTGHTIVGSAVVGDTANASARFLTRRSAANTFITYRLA